MPQNQLQEPRGIRNLSPTPVSPSPPHICPHFLLGPCVIPTVPSSLCAPSLLPSTDHCPSSPLCQYEQAADAELAWVAETKRKLMALGPIRLEQDQTTAQLQVQKVCAHPLKGWVGWAARRDGPVWVGRCILGEQLYPGACSAEPRAPGEMQHLSLRCERKKKKPKERTALNHPSVWLHKEKASCVFAGAI